MVTRRAVFLVCLFIFSSRIAPAASVSEEWRRDFVRALKNGGALVEEDSGKILFSHRSETSFIPASTLKIATSACALVTLGRDFRFPTDFFIIPDGRLVVKGYGDPFLVSEEMTLIADALAARGLKEVPGILLDVSYFEPGILIDGSSHTPNPYDALNGALIANFNTVNVHKTGSGARAAVVSAEPQTPLTAVTLEAAQGLPSGKQRVNIGTDPLKGARYAGELLAAFLKKRGIEVRGGMEIGKSPPDAKLLYHHLSSKRLDDVIRELLDYSTNFMANQLFLVMGAERYGAPANIEKGRRVLKEFLTNKVGWRGFELLEGAGLSRLNQVTPRQMIALLREFEPYRGLLPKEEDLFQAKTGTLTGVNTFAGYFSLANGHTARFAILVNDTVPFDYKFKLAKMLYAGITGNR